MAARRASLAGAAIVGALLLGSAPAAAATPVALDGIATLFTSTTPHFEAVAAQWSWNIFHAIVILDLLWTLYECIRTNTLEQLLDTLMYRVVGYALGVYLISNQISITNAVFDTISQIGAAFALPGTTTLPTPNQIVGLGWAAAGNLGTLVAPTSDFGSAIVTGIALFSCALVLQISFLVVAVEDLVIQIGAQFCIAVGSVLLGLVGTRWTRPIASLWPKMIVSMFLLTVVIGAVAGLGNQLAHQIIASVAQTVATPGGALQNYAVITAVSLVYLLLALGLTGIAAFMGAQTPLSVGGAVVNAASTMFAQVTGSNGGSTGSGGSSDGSGAGGDSDPVATIEAATTTAA